MCVYVCMTDWYWEMLHFFFFLTLTDSINGCGDAWLCWYFGTQPAVWSAAVWIGTSSSRVWDHADRTHGNAWQPGPEQPLHKWQQVDASLSTVIIDLLVVMFMGFSQVTFKFENVCNIQCCIDIVEARNQSGKIVLQTCRDIGQSVASKMKCLHRKSVM